VNLDSERLSSVYWLVAVATVVLVLAVAISGWSRERVRMQGEHATLEREVKSLELRHLQLRKQKDALASDPVYVEKIAREQLGMTKPGEIPLDPKRKRPRKAAVVSLANPPAPSHSRASDGIWRDRIIALFLLVMTVVIFFPSEWRRTSGPAEDASDIPLHPLE